MTNAVKMPNDCRYELMLDVALQTLKSDPDLRLCEGLRLIEATRTAVARRDPATLDTFDNRVLPLLRGTLMDRFGLVEYPQRDLH